MDREGRNPFDLLDEIEEKLKINVQPLSWPISMGNTFKGVYSLYHEQLHLFRASLQTVTDDVITINDISDPQLDKEVEEKYAAQLREDVELINGVYDPFNTEKYLNGELAPVFFGSAVNNFGVKELLDTFTQISPKPLGRPTDHGDVNPDDKDFSGFVFKIHANLDPRHRDRIAFLRICSGKFERNKFFHHVRLNKDVRFSSPASFMASTRSIIDEAFPGDVIGLYDTGNFKIGDTLTDGENFYFQGIPAFSPEIFKELINADPMKTKQLDKGISQLTDEGVAQLFSLMNGNRKVIGTVGELQFEVIQHRLLHEYGASCNFRQMQVFKACWITSDNKVALENFVRVKSANVATDKDDHYVYLAESNWMLNTMIENNPELEFHFTSEFKKKQKV
jgi:peptide chain release factor 3